MALIMFVMAALAFLVHLAVSRNRSKKRVVELALAYLLGGVLGLGSIAAGVFHLIDGPATAARIGWAAGSPFQVEVGVADVALGTICFLCIFIRGNFVLAALIAQSIFLFGCMAGHIRNWAESGNAAAYNIGSSIIFSDLILPLLAIGLYLASRYLERRG